MNPAHGDVSGLRIENAEDTLWLVLDAPEKLNAVDARVLTALAKVVEEAMDDPRTRAIVLTGTGRAFCSGADIAEEGPGDSRSGPDTRTLDAANRAVSALTSVRKPVVCGLNGLAAGVGVSLALACDVVVAHESAYLLLAFARIGLMPDGGATQLVAASLGRSRAMRLALLAEPLPVRDAAEAGLVAAVHGADFEQELDAMARRLADGPTTALGLAKLAVNAAALPDFEATLERERTGQMELMVGPEFAEGVDAFQNRRAARFRA